MIQSLKPLHVPSFHSQETKSFPTATLSLPSSRTDTGSKRAQELTTKKKKKSTWEWQQLFKASEVVAVTNPTVTLSTKSEHQKNHERTQSFASRKEGPASFSKVSKHHRNLCFMLNQKSNHKITSHFCKQDWALVWEFYKIIWSSTVKKLNAFSKWSVLE